MGLGAMWNNNLLRSMKYVSTIGLILANIAFFHLFSIDMKGVLIASLYFVLVAILPGYLIATWFYKTLHSNGSEKPSWHLMLGLSTIFGIGNVLLCYMMYQGFRSDIWKYFCLWPYLGLIKYVFRLKFRSWHALSVRKIIGQKSWLLPGALSYILLLNILVFQMRPTPGILPLDIFHDHLWNAGNAVSLVNGFPLKSLNIETSPFVSYHVLFHILAAHMAIMTGLTAHLTALQYIFVPLVPLLIFNMVGLLHALNIRNKSYLFYGLAVLLFGGGFAIVHEVKVRSLLNSSTNFLGVILLFSVMTTWLHMRAFKTSGRFVLVLVGVFLTTAAKGSIGASLISGSVLWIIFGSWRKSIDRGDKVDCFGAILGFLAAFFLFFIYPVIGQDSAKDFVGRSNFPIVPFAYVAKNALAGPILEVIYKYLPGVFQWLAHLVVIILMIPVHLLFYYTYRLLVVYRLRTDEIGEGQRRILSVTMGSLIVGYTVNMEPQENAYFLNSALLLLDVLFIFFINRDALFSRVKGYYRNKEIFALVGACFILVLPFINVNGWIRQEYLYNFIMYGKLGQHLDSKLKATQYRQSHQTITPEIYECLEYIRKYSVKDSVIVSPFIDLPDGRHLAYYVSAFGERRVFLEGYEINESVIRYSGLSEIKRRIEVIEGIYKIYRVPGEMHQPKYLFILNRLEMQEFERRYFVNTLFENSKWSVVRIGNERRY